MRLRAVTFREACDFIAARHRHHEPPRGHKFSLGAESNGQLVAVAVVGRPVARKSDNGRTLEVTRLCSDGTPNACSFLYSRCKRAAQALGYTRLLTFILEGEPGSSLVGAGWRFTGYTPGQSWSVPTRAREDRHPLGRKKRFEAVLPSPAAAGTEAP